MYILSPDNSKETHHKQLAACTTTMRVAPALRRFFTHEPWASDPGRSIVHSYPHLNSLSTHLLIYSCILVQVHYLTSCSKVQDKVYKWETWRWRVFHSRHLLARLHSLSLGVAVVNYHSQRGPSAVPCLQVWRHNQTLIGPFHLSHARLLVDFQLRALVPLYHRLGFKAAVPHL